jgi:hypothetical protein
VTRTVRIAATLLVAALLLGACSGGGKKPSIAQSTSTSSSIAGAPATTTAPVTGNSGPPVTQAPIPTLPPQAPAGSSPVDLTGQVLAVDPGTGIVAVEVGPLPLGLLLVAAKQASLTGPTTDLAALRAGARVEVVGYSQRVGDIRVYTAVRLVIS